MGDPEDWVGRRLLATKATCICWFPPEGEWVWNLAVRADRKARQHEPTRSKLTLKSRVMNRMLANYPILLIFRFTVNYQNGPVFAGSHVIWAWVTEGAGSRVFRKTSMAFPHHFITCWSIGWFVGCWLDIWEGTWILALDCTCNGLKRLPHELCTESGVGCLH